MLFHVVFAKQPEMSRGHSGAYTAFALAFELVHVFDVGMGRSVITVVLLPAAAEYMRARYPGTPLSQAIGGLVRADSSLLGACTYYAPPTFQVGERVGVSLDDAVKEAANRRRGTLTWAQYFHALILADQTQAPDADPPTLPIAPPSPAAIPPCLTAAAAVAPTGEPVAARGSARPTVAPVVPRRARIAPERAASPAEDEPELTEAECAGVQGMLDTLFRRPAPQEHPIEAPPHLRLGARLRRSAQVHVNQEPLFKEETYMNMPSLSHTPTPDEPRPNVVITPPAVASHDELEAWCDRVDDLHAPWPVHAIAEFDAAEHDEVLATLTALEHGNTALFLLGVDSDGDVEPWLDVELDVGIERIAATCADVGGRWEVGCLVFDPAPDAAPETEHHDAPAEEEDDQDEGDQESDGDEGGEGEGEDEDSDDDDDQDEDGEEDQDEDGQDEDEHEVAKSSVLRRCALVTCRRTSGARR